MFGGRDQAGTATNDLHVLDLGGLAQGRGWQVLACAGQAPSPRQACAQVPSNSYTCCSCAIVLRGDALHPSRWLVEEGFLLLRCRWGHSAFVYEEQLWVYGGFDGQQSFEDLWTLDLSHFIWEKVQQGGVAPNRQLSKYGRSFHAAAVSPAGHSMLAFGKQVKVCYGA